MAGVPQRASRAGNYVYLRLHVAIDGVACVTSLIQPCFLVGT